MTGPRFPYSYSAVIAQLAGRLAEPAPGYIQVLVGPRQVGKTTLLLEIASRWRGQAVYVAADAAEASLPGWWEEQWRTVERLAKDKPAVILFDEIQYLSNWNRILKAKHDQIRRRRVPVHVVVSGSSSLRIGAGTKETMAGRFERLQLLHWPARELAKRFHLNPAEAVEQIIRYGSYPGAIPLLKDFPRWRAYIRDSIIEPATGRDILATEPIRRPALLRQLFAVSVAHPAQIVSLQKICGQLTDQGALQTVAHYLHVLEEAFLVTAVHKYSERALRRRSSPPKLVVLNQAFLSAAAGEASPTPERQPEQWGRWIENACIAHAFNSGQGVYYWRAEPLEVDLITDGSWGRWAIEIKTGNYGVQHLTGLLEFCRRYPEYRPFVLCDPGSEGTAREAGIGAKSWSDFLLDGM
jgi:hypothetical protein